MLNEVKVILGLLQRMELEKLKWLVGLLLVATVCSCLVILVLHEVGIV